MFSQLQQRSGSVRDVPTHGRPAKAGPYVRPALVRLSRTLRTSDLARLKPDTTYVGPGPAKAGPYVRPALVRLKPDSTCVPSARAGHYVDPKFVVDPEFVVSGFSRTHGGWIQKIRSVRLQPDQ